MPEPVRGSFSTVQILSAVRISISTVFLLSAVGKFADPAAATSSVQQVVPVPDSVASIAVFVLSVFEAALAVAVWRRPVSPLLLVAPVIFLGILLYTDRKGLDCGCFGELPLLSRFSFEGHLLLLAGMFLGLYYLATASGKREEDPLVEPHQPVSSSQWPGVASLVLMGLALMTLVPIPFGSESGLGTEALGSATRSEVEAAIVRRDAVIVDARPTFQYVAGHIPGAINIPYDHPDLTAMVARHGLKKERVIVYCSSARCNVAEILAGRLRRMGCRDVRVYAGGWAEWAGR